MIKQVVSYILFTATEKVCDAFPVRFPNKYVHNGIYGVAETTKEMDVALNLAVHLHIELLQQNQNLKTTTETYI